MESQSTKTRTRRFTARVCGRDRVFGDHLFPNIKEIFLSLLDRVIFRFLSTGLEFQSHSYFFKPQFSLFLTVFVCFSILAITASKCLVNSKVAH